MIRITLPDGSLCEYDQPLSVFEVAASISLPLARAAVAGRVEGVQVHSAFMIERDARVSIITPREPEGLEILRHSCALLLAMAVKQLYPHARLRAGAVLGDGFSYEFACDQALDDAALTALQARMQALAATNHAFHREPTSREQALALFRQRHEPYFVEQLHALADDAQVTLYRLVDFIAPHPGPLIPSSTILQAFRLTHLRSLHSASGVLHRIYGTCWPSPAELHTWSRPPLAVVLSINEDQAEYAQGIVEALRRAGIQAKGDLRDENISHKLREHRALHVPYLLVVGEKEQNAGFVSVRSHEGEDLGRMSVEGFVQRLAGGGGRARVCGAPEPLCRAEDF